MIEEARNRIESALQATKHAPCVLLSGGIDSLLVLALVREFVPETDVVCFNQDFSKEQWKQIENVIVQWNLEVHAYPPTNRYFIPNGENLALIDEYSFGSFEIPLLRDFVDGERCALELSKERMSFFSFQWDTIFTGCLSVDENSAMGKGYFGSEVIREVGDKRFVSPLIDWTKEQVFKVAKEMNLPYSKEFYEAGDERFDTGNVSACTKCLEGNGEVFCPVDKKMIPVVDWDKSGMLDAFRNKFGFEVNV